MDANDVVKQIQAYFGDTSRSAQDTLDGLKMIAEEVESYITTLESDIDDTELEE